MIYPVAEVFDSLQGEGEWVGTPMRFIRLAGCNVGQMIPHGELDSPLNSMRIMNPAHAICSSWDGTQFLCDTDYRSKEHKSPEELLLDCHLNHVCITGGEPFLYNLAPLVQLCEQMHIWPHIETSGTLPIPSTLSHSCWITCSPKQNYLTENARYIDEYKLLVSSFTDIAALEAWIDRNVMDCRHIFIQPIGDIAWIDSTNMQRCVKLVQQHPTWRLSTQMQKLWRVR